MGAFSFQWEIVRDSGVTAIDGATNRRLKMTRGLRGRQVQVVVSFTDAAANQERVVSDPMLVPATVASTPSIRKASAGRPGGKATASVRWSAPRYAGGTAITRYRVTAVEVGRGGVMRTRMVAADKRMKSVRLPRGLYQFRVVALNAAGESRAALSKAVRAR